MSPEKRSWKHAYDKDYDAENPEYPKREDLTPVQKALIVRAWCWFAKKVWGWDGKTVPDAIPRYNEKRGWFHVPAVDAQLHHINGVGESTRLEGRTDYNRPENIAPVSARWHIGRGVRPGDEMEDEVIHDDTMQALRDYGKFKREGGKSPISKMHESRGEKTKDGQIFHNPIHDEYLTDLSQQVWDTYTQDQPTDRWQSKRKRGSKK